MESKPMPILSAAEEKKIREIVREEIAKGICNPQQFAEYLANGIRLKTGERI